MRLSLLLLFLFGFSLSPVLATHIRGGEITVERIANNPLAVRCTLTVYRDTSSNVFDLENVIYFGDNTSQRSRADSQTALPCTGTEIYTYYFTHTYNSYGVYTLYHYKDYRNIPVVNIGPNPQLVNFYIETRIVLTPGGDVFGPNRTPRLAKPAINIGAVGQKLVENPAAYDPDGDSLSYAILPSRTFIEGVGNGRADIQGYSFPEVWAGGLDSAGAGPASLTVDPITGTVTWDVPRREGEYNVALAIYEWRNGLPLGYVVRDMQIIIKDLNNKRPFLQIPQDTCVVAGDLLRKEIRARDPDANEALEITAFGGPFKLFQLPNRNAEFAFTPPQVSPAKGILTWQTSCGQVAKSPYSFVFSVQDLRSCNIKLVDIKTYRVTVIGPAPQGLLARAQQQDRIRLKWQSYICSNAKSIRIYRKVNRGSGPDDICETGVNSAYTLIATVPATDTAYTDLNGGSGLPKGFEYCYRIYALYPQNAGGESKPSNEACAVLEITSPVILNASIQATDSINGKAYVRWKRPKDLFIGQPVPPFKYQLYRTLPTSTVKVFESENRLDTTFIDTYNTLSQQATYQVKTWTGDTTLRTNRDSSQPASTVFLNLTGGSTTFMLNWDFNTPWDNSQRGADIYRSTDGKTFVYLDTASTGSRQYVDKGTISPLPTNRKAKVFYFVTTKGFYPRVIYDSILLNNSQIASAIRVDSTPPCPPQQVSISPQDTLCPTCEELASGKIPVNTLRWSLPTRDSCALDFLQFRVYFKERSNMPFTLLFSTRDTVFVHNRAGNVAGCYKVTLVDSSGNESPVTDSICNDNCALIEFPNLISPNGDAFNEFFRPTCANVSVINNAHLAIYNRWGVKVYDADREGFYQWNAKDIASKTNLPTGTYYYKADVEFIRLDPETVKQTFKGWIEVVR